MTTSTRSSPVPDTRRRNPRGEGDRLREELIATATAMVAESGDISAVTLRGVARRVGVAAPSIYRHFADVEQLKRAVVEHSFATFAAARDAASRDLHDPVQALLARCHAYCQFALDHPGPYRFMFGEHTPGPAPGQPVTGGPAIDALAASIRRCQDLGAARAGEDAGFLAAEVWAALHGLVLLRMNVPDFPWPAPLQDMVTHAVARLIQLDRSQPPGTGITDPGSTS